MSKFSECKINDSDIVKLKMVLQAMEFGETFNVTVLQMQLVVVDEDEGLVTIIMDTNRELED